MEGHKSSVLSLSIDNQRLYSSSLDGSIRIWSTQTRQYVASLQDRSIEERNYKRIVFSLTGDDKWLYSGHQSGLIRVWDKQTQQCIARLEGHTQQVNCLIIEDQLLYSGSEDNTIRVWDRKSHICKATIKSPTFLGIHSLVKKENYIYSNCRDRIIIWDEQTCQSITTLGNLFEKFTSLIADNHRLYSGSEDGTIQIWDIMTNQCTATLQGHTQKITSLVTDDELIYSGSEDTTIRVWDKQTHQCIATLEGHTEEVISLVMDDKWLYSGSQDKTIGVWNIGTLKEELKIGIKGVNGKIGTVSSSEKHPENLDISPAGHNQHIADNIEELFPEDEKYTFLVGAGISIDLPSAIPSARDICQILFEFTIPPEYLNTILKLRNLRYEYIVEKIQEFIDPKLTFLDYFDQITDPNANHYFLAGIIKSKNFVITTNLDYMIERALLRIIPVEQHGNITLVITKDDFKQCSDPQALVDLGKYVLYKVHGSKRNIITSSDTEKSLITTIRALGRNRESGKTFTIEVFKRKAMDQLLYGRTLVVMGYSGSDGFDLGPLLLEIPRLKRLIWIEHSDRNYPVISIINQNDSEQVNPDNPQKSDQLLREIAAKRDFPVLQITANTSNFVQTTMAKIFRQKIPDSSCEILQSSNKPNKTYKNDFRNWIARIFKNIPPLIKYKMAGMIFLEQSESALTIDCYTSGLAEAKNIGDLNSAFDVLKILAVLNKNRESLNYFNELIDIAEQLGGTDKKIESLSAMGSVYSNLGEYHNAIDKITEALRIAEKLGDPIKKAELFYDLGSIYEKEGDYGNAIVSTADALYIAQNSRNLYLEEKYLSKLGELHLIQKNKIKSIAYFTSAIEVVERIGDLPQKVRLLNQLGKLYENIGDYYTAIQNLTEALRIAEELGDLTEKIISLNDIGMFLYKKGDLEGALKYLLELLAVEEQIGDLKEAENIRNDIKKIKQQITDLTP